MENKTIEIYSYEDNSQKTKISIKSLVTNKEISLKQIDIAHMNFLLKYGIFMINGYVRHDDESNVENIFELNKWALIKGNEKDWLRAINIKIVRNGYVIREYIFNGFIADYIEYYDKGQARFNLVLRQYKLMALDGSNGNSGADKLDSYITHTTIKGVQGELIIKPFDMAATLLSASNLMLAISFGQNILKGSPLTLSFIFIAHGTGLVTEFMADIYFTVKGQPENMGSFNMTRDWFYKPLGELVASELEKRFSNIKIDKNLGEDIYNMGNLAFSAIDLGGKVLNIFKTLKVTKGEGILYTIRMKNVEVSFWGRQLQPRKYIGLTPIKATAEFTRDMGLDAYSTKKTFQNEIKKKKNNEYPTVNNITMPKNTDIR